MDCWVVGHLRPYATGITWPCGCFIAGMIYQDTPNKWYSRFDDWLVSSGSCLKLPAVPPRFFTTWCQFLDPSGSIQTLHSTIWSSSQENPGCAVFSVFFWGDCRNDFLPHTTFSPTPYRRWDSVQHQVKTPKIQLYETRKHPAIFKKHVEIGLGEVVEMGVWLSPIQTFGIVFCIIFPNCIFSWREISSTSLAFWADHPQIISNQAKIWKISYCSKNHHHSQYLPNTDPPTVTVTTALASKYFTSVELVEVTAIGAWCLVFVRRDDFMSFSEYFFGKR